MKVLLKPLLLLYNLYALLTFIALMLVIFPLALIAGLWGRIRGGNMIYRLCSFWGDCWFFLIGIINTLFLGGVGLVLATLVGTIVGLARTSSNELAQLLGRTYVDIFRNIPLILQVFFWYALITHLPTPRAAHEAFGMLLTSRGLTPVYNDLGNQTNG